jgi:hypothetical protein
MKHTNRHAMLFLCLEQPSPFFTAVLKAATNLPCLVSSMYHLMLGKVQQIFFLITLENNEIQSGGALKLDSS